MVIPFIFAALAGIVLGALSGLGIGGGSLLMLWLTGIVNVSQEKARLMNLMFFIPCALAACFFHFRQGKLNLSLTAIAAGAGLAGALIGNALRLELDPEPLHKALGILFLLCGIRELRYRPRELR